MGINQKVEGRKCRKHVFQFVLAVAVLTLTVGVGAKAGFGYDTVQYTTSDGKKTCTIGVSVTSTGIFATWQADAYDMKSVSLEARGSYEFQNAIGVVQAGAFSIGTDDKQPFYREEVTIGGVKAVGYIRYLNNQLIDKAIAESN